MRFDKTIKVRVEGFTKHQLEEKWKASKSKESFASFIRSILEGYLKSKK